MSPWILVVFPFVLFPLAFGFTLAVFPEIYCVMDQKRTNLLKSIKVKAVRWKVSDQSDIVLPLESTECIALPSLPPLLYFADEPGPRLSLLLWQCHSHGNHNKALPMQVSVSA